MAMSSCHRSGKNDGLTAYGARGRATKLDPPRVSGGMAGPIEARGATPRQRGLARTIRGKTGTAQSATRAYTNFVRCRIDVPMLSTEMPKTTTVTNTTMKTAAACGFAQIRLRAFQILMTM
jgi:hypothetical protein